MKVVFITTVFFFFRKNCLWQHWLSVWWKGQLSWEMTHFLGKVTPHVGLPTLGKSPSVKGDYNCSEKYWGHLQSGRGLGGEEENITIEKSKPQAPKLYLHCLCSKATHKWRNYHKTVEGQLKSLALQQKQIWMSNVRTYGIPRRTTLADFGFTNESKPKIESSWERILRHNQWEHFYPKN